MQEENRPGGAAQDGAPSLGRGVPPFIAPPLPVGQHQVTHTNHRGDDQLDGPGDVGERECFRPNQKLSQQPS